ncbi:restriction endonuclease subunit M [Spirochaetia bacterium]|nr:restriction endonuclease subunit M [Spirochaetia bacterium]
MDLAFEDNNYNIVFVNEYEKRFLDAYKYSRKRLHKKILPNGYSETSAEVFLQDPEMEKLKSMIEKERKEGHIVGFIGGPPCPDFSVAGKNRGENGENGKLTKTYFDLICLYQPDFFVFENVKGLVSTERHKKFYDTMKKMLSDNNYYLSDKLINALSYGVPQYRERIFLIGLNSKNIKNKESLTINEFSYFEFQWDMFEKKSIENILKQDWPKNEEFKKYSKRINKYKIDEELTVNYWFEKNNVTQHKNNKDVFKVKNGKQKIETINEGDTSRKSFKRLHRWKYSPTAAYGHNEVHLHPFMCRRISVAEAMAIQSLPKNFIIKEDIPLTYKFKMIGNGVPYLLGEAIAKTLYKLLESTEEIK